ncbi:MAG: hypothetical protein LBT86_05250 [Deltaproteobacteria bacterium]|jgi:hypothetical protein|nr:hypothetical protein [Deltaproteobacteria bacterium]
MFFFFLASFSLLPLGILSLLVGLAYSGQAGALMPMWAGSILILMGAWALLAFLRRLYPNLNKKSSNKKNLNKKV